MLLDKLEPSLQRKRLYAKRLKRNIFIMDGSIIPLSLSLFDWAKFRTKKGAIKLHAVLDYVTGLPCSAVLTDGKTHDVKEAQNTVFPADSVLVVDCAYVDYEWLNNLNSSGVFFVTRLKTNADYLFWTGVIINFCSVKCCNSPLYTILASTHLL